MNTKAELQPWMYMTCLSGYTPSNMTQPRDGWIDTGNSFYVGCDVRISLITGCTLNIETSNNEEGPWFIINSYTTETSEQLPANSMVAPVGGQATLDRLVRWSIERPNNNWEVCFRLSATRLQTS